MREEPDKQYRHDVFSLESSIDRSRNRLCRPSALSNALHSIGDYAYRGHTHPSGGFIGIDQAYGCSASDEEFKRPSIGREETPGA